MSKKAAKSAKSSKPQRDFILLDRSGSMTSLWEETLTAINGYVHDVTKGGVDTEVTLAVFDRHSGSFCFDVLRDQVPAAGWKDVTADELSPRGYTPLNQAVHRIVQMAQVANPDRLAMIVVTDGHENASDPEFSHESAKAALQDCRRRGWQVIFLGADFDNTQQAATLGVGLGQTVTMSSQNIGATLRATATKRSTYGITGQSMSYSDEERARFAAPLDADDAQ